MDMHSNKFCYWAIWPSTVSRSSLSMTALEVTCFSLLHQSFQTSDSDSMNTDYEDILLRRTVMITVNNNTGSSFLSFWNTLT